MDSEFYEEMEREASRWVNEGIITNRQFEEILSFYQKEKPVAKEELRKVITKWVLVFASFLVALSFFSFVAANWKFFSFFIKFTIIVISMLASYISGWYLKEYKKVKRTGESLICLGCLIYGAGIFLIGQAYNTPAYNWPTGFIFWVLGIIALAFVTDIFPLFYFAILLALIPVFGFPFLVFDIKIGSSVFLAPFWLVLITTFVLFFTGYKIYKKVKKDVI